MEPPARPGYLASPTRSPPQLRHGRAAGRSGPQGHAGAPWALLHLPPRQTSTCRYRPCRPRGGGPDSGLHLRCVTLLDVQLAAGTRQDTQRLPRHLLVDRDFLVRWGLLVSWGSLGIGRPSITSSSPSPHFCAILPQQPRDSAGYYAIISNCPDHPEVDHPNGRRNRRLAPCRGPAGGAVFAYLEPT
jgi:hypothetical protein